MPFSLFMHLPKLNFLFFAAVFFSAMPAPARAQSSAEALDRLGLNLPATAHRSSALQRSLEALSREKCDREAILELGDALQKAGFRRDAANALIRFSESCSGHAASLRTAVNIFLNITDYPKAIETASKLIAIEPYADNGHYLRGLAYDRIGDHKKAIENYATAVELFGNKAVLSSVAYVGMARNHEKLGQLCEGAHAIEAWVALNVAKNDTTQSRAMIADYMQRGNCAKAIGGREESFPAVPNQVATVAVVVNGIRGNFILDTGATYVSMKSSFAKKAGIEIEPDVTLKLSTANGLTEAARGHAASIKLRSLEAKNVTVAVQLDQHGTYGDKIDGLLGMTFLSRFNLVMEAKRIRLKAR